MYCSKERGICPLARIIYQSQILQSLYHLSISSFFPQPVATLFMKYLPNMPKILLEYSSV